ncbi:MAG: hypothetical protein MUQ10_04390 [Anaerolineae bacterium]|nr:hypothetical protein [Anaerolineae bacterium]
MDLWYSYHHNQSTPPALYENTSLWDMQRDPGIGLFGFGEWGISFYRTAQKKTEVVQTVNDGLTIKEYRTACGTLAARDLISEKLKEAAGTGARVVYPFKSSADCDALLHFIEHTTIGESFEAYGRFVEEIGGDGLALPFSALLPAHQLMVNCMGYQTFYHELHDHP